jgi:hypothetical protein
LIDYRKKIRGGERNITKRGREGEREKKKERRRQRDGDRENKKVRPDRECVVVLVHV